jgi:cbb3-type cytochrome c oxidase subunit III
MGTPTGRAAITLLVFGFATARAIEDGAAVYKASCASCHGDGPAPRFVGRSVNDVKATITLGRGKMTPLRLSPADVDAVARLTASPNASGTSFTPAPGSSAAATTKIAQGDQLVAAKDNKAALFAYLDAAYLDPRSVSARLKLAAQYARMFHPDEAVGQWEVALALEPGNEEAARGIREARAANERRPAGTVAPPAGGQPPPATQVVPR